MTQLITQDARQEQDGNRSGADSCGSALPGAPFGGYKQSGIGREECLEELISYTQEKNIYIRLPQPHAGKVPA